MDYESISNEIDKIKYLNSYTELKDLVNNIDNEISGSTILNKSEKIKLFEKLDNEKRLWNKINKRQLSPALLPIMYFSTIQEKLKHGITADETIIAHFGLNTIANSRNFCMEYLRYTSGESLETLVYGEMAALLLDEPNKAIVKNTIIMKYNSMCKLGFISEDVRDKYIEELLDILEEKQW